MGAIASLILNLIRSALALVLIASVFLICANAFGRYVLHAPIIWAEELLGYSLVWMVYLGGVAVTAERAHLKMDLLLSALGPRLKAIVELIGAVLFVVVSGLIIYQAYYSIQEFTHKSQVAELPMNVVHFVIPTAFALMAIGALAVALQDLARAGRAKPAGVADDGDAAP